MFPFRVIFLRSDLMILRDRKIFSLSTIVISSCWNHVSRLTSFSDYKILLIAFAMFDWWKWDQMNLKMSSVFITVLSSSDLRKNSSLLRYKGWEAMMLDGLMQFSITFWMMTPWMNRPLNSAVLKFMTSSCRSFGMFIVRNWFRLSLNAFPMRVLRSLIFSFYSTYRCFLMPSGSWMIRSFHLPELIFEWELSSSEAWDWSSLLLLISYFHGYFNTHSSTMMMNVLRMWMMFWGLILGDWEYMKALSMKVS